MKKFIALALIVAAATSSVFASHWRRGYYSYGYDRPTYYDDYGYDECSSCC